MLALVVERMHARGLEIQPAFHVAHEGVVVPAIPQALHDLRKFARPAVALCMIEHAVATKVCSLGGLVGGDEVPARAAMADVVERGELARQMIGLLIGGGGGGGEANVFRHHGQRGKQRERLEMRDELHRARDRFNVGFAGGVGIGQKNHVEFGALGGARGLDIMLNAGIGVGLRARMAP